MKTKKGSKNLNGFQIPGIHQILIRNIEKKQTKENIIKWSDSFSIYVLKLLYLMVFVDNSALHSARALKRRKVFFKSI